ncbi:hypothetical protein F5X97DRAFT_285629 [Nemania serpens]|nr:hypothetical protein F5X97DRAFT_285629 [Nemania serpens]
MSHQPESQQKLSPVYPRITSITVTADDLQRNLFNGRGDWLIRLLAIPVRPQHDLSPPAGYRSDSHVIYKEEKGVERSRDDEACSGASRSHEQIETQRCNEQMPPRAVITIFSLPAELYRIILSFVEDIEDAISLGLTHFYFWPVAREFLEDCFMSHFGPNRNGCAVCVATPAQSKDLHSLSAEQFSALLKPGGPYSIWAMLIDRMNSRAKLSRAVFKYCFEIPETSKNLVGSYIHEQLCSRIETATYFPESERWILRNLTTKQLVRSEAIALSPDYIHGPCIGIIGFGEVVALLVTRPTPSFQPSCTSNISRGEWDGHRFDITTLSRHEADTDAAAGWRDVSDEIAKIITSVWEYVYGADWRAIARRNWYSKNKYHHRSI